MGTDKDHPFQDGAIVSGDGRIMLFQCERFIRDICEGNCCFVCGARPDEKVFNDEHIVPNWILRRYRLHDKLITLPTGERRRYSGYKVPCCEPCNRHLGATIETPVSKLLAGDFATVAGRLDEQGREMLFTWLCLLFLKVHLKDAHVPVYQDQRKGGARIGHDYDWADLHHVHAVARTPYTGATLEPEVIGSLQIFEIAKQTMEGDYDYLDFTDAQTMLVRLGRIGIVATLNDSTAAESVWSERFDLIEGPISDLQLREVAAMFAHANRGLIERPVFQTFVFYKKWATIVARRPPLRIREFDPAEFGPALLFAVRNHVEAGAIQVDGTRDPVTVAGKISTGYVRFLTTEGVFNPPTGKDVG
ncbi:hypothetical protein [Brevundimonas sp.]|uniref:hypothetical protein n=1 Tax=Brevundimonas sp. TaxID=1871086 RepID=UPI00260A91C9|nr:hypothetical protein [Brevundimonas sp.]